MHLAFLGRLANDLLGTPSLHPTSDKITGRYGHAQFLHGSCTLEWDTVVLYCDISQTLTFFFNFMGIKDNVRYFWKKCKM